MELIPLEFLLAIYFKNQIYMLANKGKLFLSITKLMAIEEANNKKKKISNDFWLSLEVMGKVISCSYYLIWR